jgi:hypothetical protein
MWFAQWFYESSHGIHGTYNLYPEKPTEKQFGCMCIPGTLRVLELPAELVNATETEAKEYFDAGWFGRWRLRRAAGKYL